MRRYAMIAAMLCTQGVSFGADFLDFEFLSESKFKKWNITAKEVTGDDCTDFSGKYRVTSSGDDFYGYAAIAQDGCTSLTIGDKTFVLGELEVFKGKPYNGGLVDGSYMYAWKDATKQELVRIGSFLLHHFPDGKIEAISRYLVWSKVSTGLLRGVERNVINNGPSIDSDLVSTSVKTYESIQ